MKFYNQVVHICFRNKTTLKGGFITSGEGGIRTHAPLRTNGFQDRLVMTTSIPLRTLLDYLNKIFSGCQQLFLIFFIFLFCFFQTPLFKRFSPIYISSGVVIFILVSSPSITYTASSRYLSHTQASSVILSSTTSLSRFPYASKSIL